MNILLSIVIISTSVLAVYGGRLILFRMILPFFLHRPFHPKSFTYRWQLVNDWSLSRLSGIIENGKRRRRGIISKVMQKSNGKNNDIKINFFYNILWTILQKVVCPSAIKLPRGIYNLGCYNSGALICERATGTFSLILYY
jgi:hypothetical protein